MLQNNNFSARSCVLLMDSLGIGASLDAGDYGDTAANTFANIYLACNQDQANKIGVRHGPLKLPNLAELGIYHAAMASSAIELINLADLPEPQSLFGYAVERSLGKDTPSGHWEIAGVPVTFAWGYFPRQPSCFPQELIEQLLEQAQLPEVLGEKHASGTEIIKELGEENLNTKKPIIYTSADSVFQIAAHEEIFGLNKLYDICKIARQLVDKYRIARVIARPFIGSANNFKRTGNRRDYATPPPKPTLFDYLHNNQREVIAIGKTADIFAHRGITQTIKATGNMALFDATIAAMQTAPPGSLIFTNFVDFDSDYGHRRDVVGYANALEQFDARLPELRSVLQPHDIVIITADHGCDPTQPGSDHTREHIPVLVFGPKVNPKFIGRRGSFADIGQSIAEHLAINPIPCGISFL